MKRFCCPQSLLIIAVSAFLLRPSPVSNAHAKSDDAWWDHRWPYRIGVTVASPGAVGVHLNFSDLFSQLGLSEALLDVNSLRVVPYTDGVPGAPVPYEETYSTLLIDGESLNKDRSQPEPYWQEGDQSILRLDTTRFTQGDAAIYAQITDQVNLDPKPSVAYFFNVPKIQDWSPYETLTYDVWPEVNASALDQAPDLYHIQLLEDQNHNPEDVPGPPLVLDQWNHTATSLKPFGRCPAPDLSQLIGLRLLLKTNWMGATPGYFEDGDQVRLWLDNFRLVDQDGDGEIRWQAQAGVERYYVYFDTLHHASHPQPGLVTIGETSANAVTIGAVEAGGYFNQIADAETAELTLWQAPPTEKISKDQSAPVTEAPLEIFAARGEFEPMQIIVRSPTTQDLPVSVSDCVGERGVIPAQNIQIFQVGYISLTELSDFYGRVGETPDPLIPIQNGAPVTFPAGKNQPLWFRVEVPTHTPAGAYLGTISIGEVNVPFTVQVLNFTLPNSAFLPFQVGIDWESLSEAYRGTVDGVAHPCSQQLMTDVTEALADYHLTPIMARPDTDDDWFVSLTAYEVEKAHQHQRLTAGQVWWEVTGWDHPPHPNPMVIDRPGMESRILPWMAWLNRVDGLLYHQAFDWEQNPWQIPFSNDLSNGDGFLFYPPTNSPFGYDPCQPQSNQLLPSIRLELLREGLEDYAYLLLLNGGKPQVDNHHPADDWARTLIGSRTVFDRSPLALQSVRLALFERLETNGRAIFLPLFIR